MKPKWAIRIKLKLKCIALSASNEVLPALVKDTLLTVT